MATKRAVIANHLDIEISVHSYKPSDSIRRGELKLLFSGTDCNEELLNGIGRVLMKRIPTYAFPTELIKIERINPESGYTGSVPFNNDYMKLRLSQFPLLGIDSGLSLLHEKYWKDVDYLDKDREKHPDEKTIEAFVDVKNNTNDIIHVTTNDMTTYMFGNTMDKNSDMVNIYDKDYPLLIISLRPNEHFKCSMKGALGVGLRHNIWNSATNYWTDQETYPDKILFCFQSTCINEYVLFERALKHFKDKTILYKNETNRMYAQETNHSDKFEIVFRNEDHTFGAAINYEFQSHPQVRKSGGFKPDHLITEFLISIEGVDQSTLLPALMESFDNLVAKIELIEKQFKQLTQTQPKKEPQQKQEKPKKPVKAKTPRKKI